MLSSNATPVALLDVQAATHLYRAPVEVNVIGRKIFLLSFSHADADGLYESTGGLWARSYTLEAQIAVQYI